MSADETNMTTKDIARTIKDANRPGVREAVADERMARADEHAVAGDVGVAAVDSGRQRPL